MPDRTLTTVVGPVMADEVGVTDAHQHVWIEPVPGVGAGAPQLNDRTVAEEGLARYRRAAGHALLDCQPGGCGRNAAMLAELSRRSGVSIVTCTGFHLRKYYPDDYWLWSATETEAADYFIRELCDGLPESREDSVLRAGFIKIACPAQLEEMPGHLLPAAAAASRQTGGAMLIHTEQGASAEAILRQLTDLGVSSDRVVLCHMDKRPDIALHSALAEAGALLEYDTFFRPKYDPDRNVWPLLVRMLADGYASNVALGTDLADTASWREPGPEGLPLILMPRLAELGCSSEVVAALTGRNIVARLQAPCH